MPINMAAMFSVPDALEHLNKLIAKGVEYPDAEWMTAVLYCVSADKLRKAYDAQFV